MELSLDAVRTTTATWPPFACTAPPIRSQRLRQVRSIPCTRWGDRDGWGCRQGDAAQHNDAAGGRDPTG
eukprot:3002119-Prorocentrum_lima.AAC.1